MVFDISQMPADLRAIMEKAKVQDEVLEELWDAGCDSCNMFSEWVATKNVWDSAISAVANATTDNVHRVRLARLKTAWKAVKKLEEAGSSDEEDIDKPMKQSVRAKCEESFESYFHHSLSHYKSPSDSLLGRIKREISSGKFQYVDIRKVKALSVVEAGTKRTKVDLENGVSLSIGGQTEETSSRFPNEISFINALEVLTNAYLLIGFNKEVGTAKELWISKDIVLEYRELVEKSITSIGIGRVITAHQHTFTKVAELLRSKKESRFDNALKRSTIECMAYFTTISLPAERKGGPKGKGKGDLKRFVPPVPTPMLYQDQSRVVPQPPPPPSPSPSAGAAFARSLGKARIDTVPKLETGQFICKFFADGRGCHRAQTCKNAHVCDVKVNGRACGGPHTRENCPNRTTQ